MSQYQEKLSERQKEYDSLNPLTANNFAPRVGYYVIQELYQQTISGTMCRMAKVLWKKNIEDRFFKDLKLSIQLRSFESPYSKGPINLLQSNLVGTIIHVSNAWVNSNDSVKEFHLEWGVVKMDLKYETPPNHLEADEDLQLVAAIDTADEEELDLISVMNRQILDQEDVMAAIYMMEDNQYEELDEMNDWIFALQAQDLPEENKHDNSTSKL